MKPSRTNRARSIPGGIQLTDAQLRALVKIADHSRRYRNKHAYCCGGEETRIVSVKILAGLGLIDLELQKGWDWVGHGQGKQQWSRREAYTSYLAKINNSGLEYLKAIGK